MSAGAAKGPGAREVVFGLHPVLEALGSGRRRLDHVMVAREARGPRLGRLLAEARRAGIPVRHVPREALERKVGRGAAHQGVAAVVSPVPYADPEELCRAAAADPGAILLVLDGLEDPRNLGAILRTAAGVGARGVLLGGDRTVGITAAAAKTAAGAAERVRVAREPRPGRRLESLRRAGFRLVALDPRGETPWDRADLRGRLALVVGGEGRGLKTALRAACHDRVAIPLAAGVESLNVSVAVAVVLFEAVRQRRSMRLAERPAGDLERGERGW